MRVEAERADMASQPRPDRSDNKLAKSRADGKDGWAASKGHLMKPFIALIVIFILATVTSSVFLNVELKVNYDRHQLPSLIYLTAIAATERSLWAFFLTMELMLLL